MADSESGQTEALEGRDAGGRFAPGNRWSVGRGRPRGAVGALGAALRDAVVDSAERHPGGLGGLLDDWRDNRPDLFAALLRRCIPEAREDVGGDVVVHVVTGVPRPAMLEAHES